LWVSREIARHRLTMQSDQDANESSVEDAVHATLYIVADIPRNRLCCVRKTELLTPLSSDLPTSR
jgi:hypothetical protein